MRNHSQLKKLFARVLIALTILTALTQVTGAEQASGRVSPTAVLPNASAPSQALQSAPLRAAGNAGDFPVSRSQTRRQSVGSLPSSGDFLPAVAYDSGGYVPFSVAVADVNGDGKPDLVVANSYACYVGSCLTGSVAVLLGNSDGTFKTAVTYDSGGAQTYSVVIADVNGDGKPDIVLANYCVSRDSCVNGLVGVLLGNGDGTFKPAVTYNSGGYGTGSVAVADVNSDGNPDLLVANYCDRLGCPGSVGVLLGNGDGTFQDVVTYGSGVNFARSVAVADVNSDGKVDVLIGSQCRVYPYNCQDLVGVLLGNGDGTFQPVVTYNSGDQYESSVVVADVNGDGKPDLLTTNLSSDIVGVLLNKGDGTFQTVVTYKLGGAHAFSVAVADVNDDGKPDLVVAHEYDLAHHGSLGVLLGNGNGTFQPALEYNSGGDTPSLSVRVADLNGDGKPDLLVTNTCVIQTSCATGSVGVLLNNAGVHSRLRLRSLPG